MNTISVPITPKAIQDLFDELEASRASRKRAWELLQELRWIVSDVTGVQAPAPERKTIDLEGRIVKETVRRVLRDRQNALAELAQAVREYRKLADQALTLRDSLYAEAARKLERTLDAADRLLA